MENITVRFVKRLYDMSRSEFPDKIIEKSRDCFADYLSVVIGGCKMHINKNDKFLRENNLSGAYHIIGSNQRTELSTSVMINAFNAHVLELDDSHRVAMTHLGAPIFSALLGAAELFDSTLEELLCGAVVGYEAAVRLASAIQPSHKKRGFHVSGTCCTVGCAMGIASMLKYSFEEMENVFSAAATSAAGLLAVSSGSSEQKPYNIANAAVAGLNAALYGKLFRGSEDILGDPRGFLNAMSDQYEGEKLFESGYAIEGIYQKLYAACRHCHAPMEAMLKIREANQFDDKEIESVIVKTYDLAIKGHDHTQITGISSAKQSIPYGVAVACCCRECGMSAFTTDKVSDDNILKITRKVKVVEDPELSELVPKKRAAIVCVKLIDGTLFEHRVDFPKGEPENPISQIEFSNKFFELIQSAGIKYETGKKILKFVNGSGETPVKMIFMLI